MVPPNLPVGSSRLLTFSEDRARLSPADVAEGFRRVGPILRFDGQINASTNPVVVAIRQPRDPSRPGHRLVLAMEQPTICQSETQPRLDRPIEEVIDISINQTLSRTLLTSVTTLLALIVIFWFSLGQQHVLEGFSFAMIIGVLVGTYSSIFVASPLVSMLARRAEEQTA